MATIITAMITANGQIQYMIDFLNGDIFLGGAVEEVTGLTSSYSHISIRKIKFRLVQQY